MSFSSTEDRRSSFLRVLRRRAWIVVLFAILGGGAAYLVVDSEQKQYTASASLLFQEQQLGQEVFGYSVATPVDDPNVIEATDVELASAPIVASAAASRLGMPLSTVDKAISVRPAGSSEVVTVSATTKSPQLSATIANAYAQSVVNTRRTAEQQLVAQATRQVRGQLQSLLRSDPTNPQVGQVRSRLSQLEVLSAVQTGDVQIANPAKAPTAPSGPRVHRDAGFGLLLGLIIGLGLVFLLERIDRRVREEDELASLYGLTVLSHIPRSRALDRSSSARPPIADPASAEAFRILRARLRYFNVDRKLQTLLITSAVPQEGKTTVAWQLAWAAASTAPDEAVLLIEADLRRPSVATTTGLNAEPGLSDALTQLDDWREAVQILETGPGEAGVLQVITAGGTPPNPTELIESDKLRSLVAEARSEYALIVIDAPPVLLVSDALALVQQVDGVVVVGRINHTQRDAATGLRTILEELRAPVLGVVINGVAPTASRYGYGPYDPPSGKAPRRRPESLPSQ